MEGFVVFEGVRVGCRVPVGDGVEVNVGVSVSVSVGLGVSVAVGVGAQHVRSSSNKASIFLPLQPVYSLISNL